MDIALALVIYGGWVLALARLTRLATKDVITDFYRIKVLTKYGEDHKLSELVMCGWCMSMWIAMVTAPFAIWLAGVGWWYYPIVVLSGSHLVGLLQGLDDEDVDIEIQDE